MQNQRFNRRTLLKKSFRAAGSIAMLTGASGIYGIFGERYWIQVREINLAYSRLPRSFSGVRIVQFSDTHIGRHYRLNHLARAIELIQQQKPDIICFTGDLFDAKYGMVSDDVIPLLSNLQAGLGKFAVLGNHDMRMSPDPVRSVLERSGFSVLINENYSIQRGDEMIQVVGIDEMIYGNPDFRLALQGVGKNEFALLLAHEPDFADTAVKYRVDLQLSGHSHGGQIRIPFYGSVFLPDGAKKYDLGLYSFEGSEFRVYTNRGIGTTLFPIRFNCRPEITVFTLTSKR